MKTVYKNIEHPCQDLIEDFFEKCKDKKSKYGGYISIRVNGVSIPEHRRVIQQYLGRKLKRGETIHHIDHDRGNNKLKNLIVCKDTFAHKIADSYIQLCNKHNIPYEISDKRELIFNYSKIDETIFPNFKEKKNEKNLAKSKKHYQVPNRRTVRH